MTENVKAFLEKATEDEEFLERLKKVKTKEEAIALAKEKGFDLSEEDLTSKFSGKQELSDDELDAVAGGNGCFCIGIGNGSKGNGDNNSCFCLLAGEGLNNSAQDCDCIMTGNGKKETRNGKDKYRFFCSIEGDSLGCTTD